MRTMGIQEDVTFRALKSKVESMKKKWKYFEVFLT
jgi:hypothetical protein